MRDLINIVSLTEGVTFRPAVKEIIDGETCIAFPPAGTTKVSEPCPGCEYGREHLGDNWNPEHCQDCLGAGEITDTVYNFPNLDVSYFQVSNVASMLGFDGDSDEHGWVEPSELPMVMRRLIALKNGDSSHHTSDNSFTPSQRIVDKSGEITQIRSTPAIYSGGRSQETINRYIDRLIEIVRWAQEHNCGISWA